MYIINPHEFVDVDVNCDTLGHQNFILLKVRWLEKECTHNLFFMEIEVYVVTLNGLLFFQCGKKTFQC